MEKRSTKGEDEGDEGDEGYEGDEGGRMKDEGCKDIPKSRSAKTSTIRASTHRLCCVTIVWASYKNISKKKEPVTEKSEG